MPCGTGGSTLRRTEGTTRPTRSKSFTEWWRTSTDVCAGPGRITWGRCWPPAGQVDPPPALGKHVGRPRPAVRSLQDHLRVRARLGHLQAQGHRVVLDPDQTELLALSSHPDDDAPAGVQVDSDVLSLLLHGVPPPSLTAWCSTPSFSTLGPRRRTGTPCFPDGPVMPTPSHTAPGRTIGTRHAEATLRSFITSELRS